METDFFAGQEDMPDNKPDYRELAEILLSRGMVAPELDQSIFANLSEEEYEAIISLISSRTWF